MSTDAWTGPAPSPTGPLSTIDYSERIPNNVNLAGDRRLQRALEGWQPKFLDWWKQLGPALPTKDVYLRTAIAVATDGNRRAQVDVLGWQRWAELFPPVEELGLPALERALQASIAGEVHVVGNALAVVDRAERASRARCGAGPGVS